MNQRVTRPAANASFSRHVFHRGMRLGYSTISDA